MTPKLTRLTIWWRAAVVCDRRVKEECLPANLVVIAACNPYRRSHSSTSAGLVYQYSDAQATQEELKQLAYMVHPLPEIMKQYVWDFGSLTIEAEEKYIERILVKSFTCVGHGGKPEIKYSDVYETFCKAVHQSHVFIKENQEHVHGMVSLRDVLRCSSLYTWFLDYLFENRGKDPNHQDTFKTAVILSLAICYYFRLSCVSTF